MFTDQEKKSYLDWASKHPNPIFSQVAWHIIESQDSLKSLKYPDPNTLIEPNENQILSIEEQISLKFLLLRLLNGKEDAVRTVENMKPNNFFGAAGHLINILKKLREYKVNQIIINDKTTSDDHSQFSQKESQRLGQEIDHLISQFDGLIMEFLLQA